MVDLFNLEFNLKFVYGQVSRVRLVSVTASKSYQFLIGSDSEIVRAAGLTPTVVGKWMGHGMPVWAGLIISANSDIPFCFSGFALDCKVFLKHVINEITSQQHSAPEARHNP